jgi:hypothetical protein
MHVAALEEAQAFVRLRGSAIRELATPTAEDHHRQTEQPRVNGDTVLTGG